MPVYGNIELVSAGFIFGAAITVAIFYAPFFREFFNATVATALGLAFVTSGVAGVLEAIQSVRDGIIEHSLFSIGTILGISAVTIVMAIVSRFVSRTGPPHSGKQRQSDGSIQKR